MPPLIVDAHQDLAYNALTFERNYLQSALDTRRQEEGTLAPLRNGQTMLGWPEFQQARVALIFATLFIAERGALEEWETQVYRSPAEARSLWQAQLDSYLRLSGEHPDRFRLIEDRSALSALLAEWQAEPAGAGNAQSVSAAPPATHPVGLVLLMENAEGLREPRELEDWHAQGVRLVGPVWAEAGTRFCGGTRTAAGFTREGHELLEVMAGLGLALDIAHMSERAALQALDRYEGPLAATHANCRALLRRSENERHLSDDVIRRLIERDGVMGISPYAAWLRPGFSRADDPTATHLGHLVAHIDHVCQLAGDAAHVGLGTDFDGGWGWPHVPHELNTIGDLQKLGPRLAEAGYSEADVAAILGGNWVNFLQRGLPA